METPLGWPPSDLTFQLLPTPAVQSAPSHLPFTFTLHYIQPPSGFVVIRPRLVKRAVGKEGELRVSDQLAQWPSSTRASLHRRCPTEPSQPDTMVIRKVASTQARLREARKKHSGKALPHLTSYAWPFKLWAAICLSLQELTIFCLARVSQILHWSLCPTDVPLSLGICRLDSWERPSTGVGSPSSQVVESPVHDSFCPLYVSCLFLSVSRLCSSHEGVEDYFMVGGRTQDPLLEFYLHDE